MVIIKRQKDMHKKRNQRTQLAETQGSKLDKGFKITSADYSSRCVGNKVEDKKSGSSGVKKIR